MIILGYSIVDAGDQTTAATLAALEGALDLTPGGPDASPLELMGYGTASFSVIPPPFPGAPWRVVVLVQQTATSDQISPTADDNRAACRNLYTGTISAATGARVVADEPIISG